MYATVIKQWAGYGRPHPLPSLYLSINFSYRSITVPVSAPPPRGHLMGPRPPITHHYNQRGQQHPLMTPPPNMMGPRPLVGPGDPHWRREYRHPPPPPHYYGDVPYRPRPQGPRYAPPPGGNVRPPPPSSTGPPPPQGQPLSTQGNSQIITPEV